MQSALACQSAGGPARPPVPAGSAARPFVRDGKALTFLIVEDEAIIAMDLESMVTEAGGRAVGLTATAAEAERLARVLRPDVVLMDVRLKGDRDGIAAAQAIRSAIPTSVVFVTGNEDVDTVARIKASGGSDPVQKPVRPGVLVEAVLKALRGDAVGGRGPTLQ